MSVKTSLLSELENNKGQEISGQALADSLGVTRAAVWKAAKALETEGYPIKATRNKGYLLECSSDIISAEGIRSCLDKSTNNMKIIVLDTVDSTIIYGKSLAPKLEGKPALVVALEQTAGIGRRGHSFYSPRDTGIYMSLILTPKIKTPTLITIAAAIAVCKAIEKLANKTPGIKWVNDIFLDGKKVCGILTQGIMDFETQTIDAAVIGIGVNLSTKDFPVEIKDIATAVFPQGVSRNEFIASITNYLYELLNNDYSPGHLISEYKKRLFVLGQRVSYSINGENKSGVATDVNLMGNLIVDTDSGTDVLTAGEISAKPILPKRND